jgi:hypothetical protein
MAGLVPAIHVFAASKAWMPGTRPGMTREETISRNKNGRIAPAIFICDR